VLAEGLHLLAGYLDRSAWFTITVADRLRPPPGIGAAYPRVGLTDDPVVRSIGRATVGW